jgi:hypothetical protein
MSSKFRRTTYEAVEAARFCMALSIWVRANQSSSYMHIRGTDARISGENDIPQEWGLAGEPRTCEVEQRGSVNVNVW